MKPVSVLLVAAVLVYGASAQTGGCPPAKASFGICTFDPSVNCLEDSECSGGKLCCADGCGKVCKDPEGPGVVQTSEEPSPAPGIEIKQCPKAANQFGICVFDEKINCGSDSECQNGQMCCPEGCNSVCKDPVTFQPIKPQPKQAQAAAAVDPKKSS